MQNEDELSMSPISIQEHRNLLIGLCYASGEERKNSERFQMWKEISKDEF